MVKITMLIQSFGQKVSRWELLKNLVWVSNEQIDEMRSRIREKTIHQNQLKFVST
jgi:hypothetical protein